MHQNLPDLKASFLEGKELTLITIPNIREVKFDMDVYLPTRGINLQRGYIWTKIQKRSLIESILIRRHIPPISAIYNDSNVYEVIDGKQRLGAILDFIDNKFTYCEYVYSELPEAYYKQFNRFQVRVNRLLPPPGIPITDQEKIEWFRFINFAGTPQDLKHFAKLAK